jgi:general secretion pathway protein C
MLWSPLAVAALVLLACITGCGGPLPPAQPPAAVAAPVAFPPPSAPAPVRARPPAPGPASALPRLQVRLDREWVERLREGDGRVWGSANIAPSVDEAGRPNGLTLVELRPDGIYGSAGLRDGDTVKAVNGLPLTSEAKALEAYLALRSATRVELLVVRRGAPLVIVVVLGD